MQLRLNAIKQMNNDALRHDFNVQWSYMESLPNNNIFCSSLKDTLETFTIALGKNITIT
jgi:hypothetical protein